MDGITQHETDQIEAANASGKTPVVFVHGLWLLPSSWDRWATLFEDAGYATARARLARRPRDGRRGEGAPRGVRQQVDRAGRRPLRRRDPAADEKPAVIGHSFGGLLTQILAGRGLLGRLGGDRSGAVPGRPAAADLGAAVGVAGAAESAQPRPRRAADVRPVPVRVRQRRRRGRGEASSTRRTPCRRPGEPLFQAAAANLNPWTEAKVDTKNPERGPLLILDGELDHTVPWSIANASYKRQKRNAGVTEIVKVAGRGHALTIDSGWREVADMPSRSSGGSSSRRRPRARRGRRRTG